MLTIAGFQVPGMPSLDIVGRIGAIVPAQNGETAVKVGATFGVTVTVRLVSVAHKPASGVNVYVAVSVLLTIAGLQLPVIPSFDVVGRIGAWVPAQSGETAVKVGATFGVTVTVWLVSKAHCPTVGMKV